MLHSSAEGARRARKLKCVFLKNAETLAVAVVVVVVVVVFRFGRLPLPSSLLLALLLSLSLSLCCSQALTNPSNAIVAEMPPRL